MARDDDDRIPAWRRYLRFWRSNPAGDVDDEVEFHLQSTIEELVAGGMSRDHAREIARRKFGDVGRIRSTLYTLSEQRERRMAFTDWLGAIRQDLVFGARQLRKSPAFTTVAVLTLALGIGANSAIFSVVYSVLLRPLPYANTDRLLSISEKSQQGTNAVTFGNYASWRQQSKSFEAIGAMWGQGPLTLTGAGDPTPLPTYVASASYWNAVYIRPLAGRYFNDTEDRMGSPHVVVLSAGLWRNRFQADPSIVGRSITLGGEAYTVVGVAPADYLMYGPAGGEVIWIPLIVPPSKYNDHSDHELSVFGLVRPGVPVQQAAHELSVIERNLAKEYPHSGFDDVDARPIVETVVGPDTRSLVLTLFGAVSLVLLIACANVSNLLIARASVRRAELAVRGALGASRARIVAQLFTESVILGLVGGALGLLVAMGGIRFLVTSPTPIPRLSDTTLNPAIVAFTMLLALGCAIVFGLLPAIHAARLDLQQTLRDGGRESAVSSRDRVRGALVVGELCLTQVLLVGAGLLIRSAMAAQAIPPGFNPQNLLVVSMQLPYATYKSGQTLEAGFQRLDEAIAAVPGVQSVGRASLAPIYDRGWNCATMREGSNGHDEGAQVANMRSANETYFSAVGVPLLRGRAFTRADGGGAPQVAIINRKLAHDLFGDADPIGRLVAGCADKTSSAQSSAIGTDGLNWRQVVGVIGDMRAEGLTADAPRELYMPSAQWATNNQMSFVVRGSVPVAGLAPAIRRAVAGVDPLLALSRVRTMDDAIGRKLAVPRFTMWLLSLLGGTGLALAIVGIYGVIAYFVTQRTHEIGVRMALGASGTTVQWMVVRQGLLLGVVGVAVGTAVSYGASRFIGTLMFGITAHDPETFVAVATALTAVAVVASYLPARRATRIDPLEALRAS